MDNNRVFEKTIFEKIISGEVPSYKVYEDELTCAFLDAFPTVRGHVLVVPKRAVDKIYDLSSEDWDAVWATVKKMSVHMEKVLGQRIFYQVMGTEVSHAHVHLIPQSPDYEQGKTLELTAEEMREIADKIRLS